MSEPVAAAGSTYLLPLRWMKPGPIDGLAAHLSGLEGAVGEILVVDGSPEPHFEAHARALRGIARHLRPDPDLDFPMGKVSGVITGIRACSGERVVIADDDVRYGREEIKRALALLADADLVRPQNHFADLPWHARWDTARSLLNRVFSGDLGFPVGDFPGTLAVRRSAFLAAGAYDGEALFENLELMRTISAAGGRVITPLDLYVARSAPTAAQFLSQRVRQAYDDFAVPLRLGAFLAVGPAGLWLSRDRRGRRRLLGAALAAIGLAEVGRRRAGGAAHFPLSASLLAPAWITERSICAWLAVGSKLRGGVRYGEGRVSLAANSSRRLRDRQASTRPSPGSSGPLSERNPISL